MEARCRLCAECSPDFVPVLEELELSERILQLFQVKIEPEDRLPTVVCRCCCTTVYSTWEFNQRVQKAQELLAVEEGIQDTFEPVCADVTSWPCKEESDGLDEYVLYNAQTDAVDAQPNRKAKVKVGIFMGLHVCAIVI